MKLYEIIFHDIKSNHFKSIIQFQKRLFVSSPILIKLRLEKDQIRSKALNFLTHCLKNYLIR